MNERKRRWFGTNYIDSSLFMVHTLMKERPNVCVSVRGRVVRMAEAFFARISFINECRHVAAVWPRCVQAIVSKVNVLLQEISAGR